MLLMHLVQVTPEHQNLGMIRVLLHLLSIFLVEMFSPCYPIIGDFTC